MKKKISFLDGALLLSSILLAAHMFFRFFDLATIINFFPFDYTNDLSSYLSQLYFLDVCGYHQFCPYWYNGFITFLITPPGWYFLAYPFYFFTHHIALSFYLSIVFMTLLGLAVCLFFGKKFRFSFLRSSALFFFLFGNAINIGNFLRLGRVHAMLNFILFITFFFILWYYKDKKLDFRFFFSSVIYSFMIVTHYQETVLAGIFFAGFFLYRSSLRDRTKVIIASLLAILLSSWWLFGFIANLEQSSLLDFHEGKRALDFQSDRLIVNLFTYFFPLLFIILFFIYRKTQQYSRRDIFFFSPSLILAFVYLFRLHSFIPILRNISQDPYILFFYFQIIFLLFIIFDDLSLVLRRSLGIIIIVFTIFSILANIFITPYLIKHTPLDEEMKSTLSKVTERYLFFGPLNKSFQTSYSKAYYSYGSIYYNLSTAEGWSPPLASLDYLLGLDSFGKRFPTLLCSEIEESLEIYNTTQIVTYDTTCQLFANCNFTLLAATDHICLYDRRSIP